MSVTRARWTPRTYVTQTGKQPLDEVDGIKGVNAFRIYSMPYQIHSATVTRAHEHAMWVVHLTTVATAMPYRFHLQAEAEHVARDLVSRKAGADMQTFSRGQRVYMGQQLCPKILGALMCGQPAGVGTVWCEWHPRGERRADD